MASFFVYFRTHFSVMIFTEIDPFLKYYSRLKERSLRIISFIPTDKIEWTFKEGKFTLGDLVRHLACIERYMYAENAQFLPSRYQGCGLEYAGGYEEVVAFYKKSWAESREIFSKISPEDLQKKTITPAGNPITLWKWLRAMAEHEIHHRAQIYTYLAMLDVKTPPLYGLTAEEVQARSNS